ncbi:MAG: ParB N-terminal domain-containing protein, partial [Chloroflexi bacterium]|nr:ParB N-terminal domain-containing protein [Chloroflexota bacterium]
MTRSPTTITVEHVPPGDLVPDAFNPRRIKDAELEALTRSIREFGLVDPIIAGRQDRTIIGGHQRVVAARKLGLKTLPVIYLDLTQEQARLLNLALNRISGSWDEELLARLLAELDTFPDVDISLSGFGEDEVKKLLKSMDARDKRERPEDFDLEAALEAAKREPRSRRGDLWRLGDHRLLCGDSTDGGDVERLMGGAKAPMAFTDPPCNVDFGNHGGAPRKGRRRTIA